jgi:hypothetical protein
VAANLALLLFAPWFAILGWAYWNFPRAQVAGGATRGFDIAVLLLSLLLSAVAMRWTYAMEFSDAGKLWPQVLATLAAYHAFLFVLVAGWFLRAHRLRRLK